MVDMDYKENIIIALKSNYNFFILEGNENSASNILHSVFDDSYFIIEVDANDLDADKARKLVLDFKILPDREIVYIIKKFENLTDISQNILLKSLEELNNVKVFGLCSQTFGILDTILSRAYCIFINSALSIKDEIDKVDESYLLRENKKIDEIEYLVYKCKDIHKLEEVQKTNLLILEFEKRIDANCNKDLCLDLLIYKLLEV